jgi:hypothetical protein
MKSLLLLFLSTTAAHAATVFVTNPFPPATFRHLSGALISPLSTIRVGFFTGAVNFNCESNPLSLQNFVPLGEATSPAGYGTPAGNSLQVSNGVISGNINDITFGTGTPNTLENGFLARGTRLYLVVEDGGEWGAFSATLWNVPTSNLVNIMTLIPRQVDTPQEVFWGQTDGNMLLSPQCPEPSVSLLCLLTGAALLSRPASGRRSA